MLNFIAPLMGAPAAGGAGATGQADFSFLIMMLLVFAAMYFFMLRPQQKKQKEILKFREGLAKGDKIVTAGGIYGVIKSVEATTVILEVEGGSVLKVDKTMVMRDMSDIQQK